MNIDWDGWLNSVTRVTPQGREAPHVVLYEDVSKKRVRRLVTAIRDTGAVGRALAAIEKVRQL